MTEKYDFDGKFYLLIDSPMARTQSTVAGRSPIDYSVVSVVVLTTMHFCVILLSYKLT